MEGESSVPWLTATGRECTTSPCALARMTAVPMFSSSGLPRFFPRAQSTKVGTSGLVALDEASPSKDQVMAPLLVLKLVSDVQLANAGEHVLTTRFAGVNWRSTYACPPFST